MPSILRSRSTLLRRMRSLSAPADLGAKRTNDESGHQLASVFIGHFVIGHCLEALEGIGGALEAFFSSLIPHPSSLLSRPWSSTMKISLGVLAGVQRAENKPLGPDPDHTGVGKRRPEDSSSFSSLLPSAGSHTGNFRP